MLQSNFSTWQEIPQKLGHTDGLSSAREWKINPNHRRLLIVSLQALILDWLLMVNPLNEFDSL